MESPFVLRKTYEILKENCRLIDRQRLTLAKRNKELQLKIKELQKELERVTALKAETANAPEKPKRTRKPKTEKKEG